MELGPTLDSLKQYFRKYDSFVKLNPRLATEVEAIIRWSSYLLASRKSPILCELLSSAANLLQLCNDLILRQANRDLRLDLKDCATQLKTFLSVLHSLELLAEIYARDTYGTAGKWAIITVIQITKAAIKLVLLFIYDDGLTQSQSIIPLDRIHYYEIVKLQNRFAAAGEDEQDGELAVPGNSSSSKSVVLKSSGRKMRSITESPPKGKRFSKESEAANEPNPFANLQKKRLSMLIARYTEQKTAKLSERQLYGEILHIARPIAHLALMGSLGTKSWISYFTSMFMDLSSLYLVRHPGTQEQLVAHGQQVYRPMQKFGMTERMELGQRASSLLLYLLRSPFFEEYTKQRALEGIASTAENVPLIGHLIATFVNYIPDWQNHYFRVWSE